MPITQAAEVEITEFSVPKGHRGALVLVFKNGEGLKLPRRPSKWTFAFPDGGFLIVDRSTYIMARLSKLPNDYTYEAIVHDSGGQPLLYETVALDDQIALRSVYGVGEGVESGFASSGAIYYFIGTRAEADNFKEAQEQKFCKSKQGAIANF